MSLVSLVRIEKNNLRKAIENALLLANYEFKKDARKIVIKPNMCYYWDRSTGQTTDPEFIKALIEIIRDNVSKPEISIVESDASAMKCEHSFRFLGYGKSFRDCDDVRLVNLSEDKCNLVKVGLGRRQFHLMVPQTIQHANLKINVPKIKYMGVSGIKITCALKNIYGCNPYPKKLKYHPNLDETIVAINKAMKFDLILVDGNIVSGGQPLKLGLVMAGIDSVAIDAAAARIAGVNPKAIKYLQLASKEGLGQTSFVDKGVPIDYFKARYPREDVHKKLMNKAYDIVVLMGLGKKLGLE